MTKEQMYILGFETACDRIKEELIGDDLSEAVDKRDIVDTIDDIRSRVNG